MKKLALFLALLLPLQAFANGNTAEQHMQKLGTEVIEILNNDDLEKAEVQKRFESMLDENFALQSMGKFVLGKYWRRATAEEKEEFQKLFRKSILKTYSTKFETNTKATFEVTGSREESDGAIIITSKLNRPGAQPIKIDWRLYDKDGKYKIYDVLLEGVSMSITQRSEYAAVIQREGGKIGGLNKAIQSNTTHIMG